MGRGRGGDELFMVGCGCACCTALSILIIIICSFQSLHTTEVALDYNGITKTVHDRVYDKAGLHFLGLGHSFIKFPNLVQTMQFTEGNHQILMGRTSDGLPLSLGVSFQYRYIASRLYDLYIRYGGNHLPVYNSVATGVIANEATNWTAYDFFQDKQKIARSIQDILREKFAQEMYASVEQVQIITMELPQSFQNAILESIATKQNITASEKYKNNMLVTFERQQMVAEQTKNQTITLAQGTANQILTRANANAEVTKLSVYAEMYAYGNLSEAMGMGDSSEDLLQYVWWQDLAAAAEGSTSEFLVGVNPAAYISSGGSQTV